MKFDYGEIYKKYNMDGIIQVGTGTVKVHDIFDETPEFMKEADCIFVDPPCSAGNLSTFYTKAEKAKRVNQFAPFEARLFEVIREINPEHLFIEVFKSNKDSFYAEIQKMYKHTRIYNSMYYGNKKNQCWIIQASNTLDEDLGFDGLDEEKIIEKLCEKDFYSCIGDMCMGKGLVGFYANKNGKRFVGTELNEKRLAVLIERIKTGRILMK